MALRKHHWSTMTSRCKYCDVSIHSLHARYACPGLHRAEHTDCDDVTLVAIGYTLLPEYGGPPVIDEPMAPMHPDGGVSGGTGATADADA